jgi:hypothetical protein
MSLLICMFVEHVISNQFSSSICSFPEDVQHHPKYTLCYVLHLYPSRVDIQVLAHGLRKTYYLNRKRGNYEINSTLFKIRQII